MQRESKQQQEKIQQQQQEKKKREEETQKNSRADREKSKECLGNLIEQLNALNKQEGEILTVNEQYAQEFFEGGEYKVIARLYAEALLQDDYDLAHLDFAGMLGKYFPQYLDDYFSMMGDIIKYTMLLQIKYIAINLLTQMERNLKNESHYFCYLNLLENQLTYEKAGVLKEVLASSCLIEKIKEFNQPKVYKRAIEVLTDLSATITQLLKEELLFDLRDKYQFLQQKINSFIDSLKEVPLLTSNNDKKQKKVSWKKDESIDPYKEQILSDLSDMPHPKQFSYLAKELEKIQYPPEQSRISYVAKVVSSHFYKAHTPTPEQQIKINIVQSEYLKGVHDYVFSPNGIAEEKINLLLDIVDSKNLPYCDNKFYQAIEAMAHNLARMYKIDLNQLRAKNNYYDFYL